MTVFRNHYQHRRQHPSLTGSYALPQPTTQPTPQQVFKVFPNRLIELPAASSVVNGSPNTPHRASSLTNLSHRVVHTNGTLAMIVPGSAGGDSWRDLPSGGPSPMTGG